MTPPVAADALAVAQGMPPESSGDGLDAAAVAEEGRGAFHLPAEPLIVIRPSGRWVPIRFRDLWAYRELLYFLTWRDVKVRYKQTLLGASWAILQPLCTMLVFTVFFGRLASIPSDGIPYSLFAYAGLLPWLFFSNAVTNSGNSLLGSANLVTKVYFPRMLIPAAVVGAGLVDFAFGTLALGGLLIYHHVTPTWNLLLFPPLALVTTLAALSLGLGIAALTARYRDLRHLVPFLLQLGMFVTPIIYPPSMLPRRWAWLLSLNPMSGIIQGFRASLFGRPVEWQGVALATVMTLLLLTGSAYLFRRMERDFADVI